MSVLSYVAVWHGGSADALSVQLESAATGEVKSIRKTLPPTPEPHARKADVQVQRTWRALCNSGGGEK